MKAADALGSLAVIVAGIVLLQAWKSGRDLFASMKASADQAARALASGAKAVVSAVNPADPGNVVNRGANSLLQLATGNDVDTIGTRLAATFDPITAAIENNIPIVAGKPATAVRTWWDDWDDDLANAARASAAQAKIYEGPGGAAFGIYPRAR
jgi:uncharacterized protein (UPF0333 family)